MIKLANFFRPWTGRIVLIFGVLFFSFLSTLGLAQEERTKLRVGITLENNFVEVSINDSYRLVEQATEQEISLSPGKYSFHPDRDDIQIKDESGDTIGHYPEPLCLEPGKESYESSVFIIHNAEKGEKYRGALEITKDGQDELQAINIVTLESYARGVVPREMPASWGNYGGMHALKAQAVASRTYALYHQQQGRHDGYDLCDTQHCQVYGGKNSEHENTNQAVKETRGEILKYQGEIIPPFYHATNGGYTELAQNVWSESLPYLDSVHDPYDDPDNPKNIKDMIIHTQAKWETSLPVREIESKLDLSRSISDIEVISTFSSGRVNELQIQLAGGEALSYFRQHARSIFGLRSQMFQISDSLKERVWLSGRSQRQESVSELEGKWAIDASGETNMLIGDSFSVEGASEKTRVPHKSYVFTGKGWGHGIGMSQNGAYNRSRDNHTYQEILSFYYPGTDLSLID